MQIGTLKLLRLTLVCVFFISILLVVMILKLNPVIQFSAAEGNGVGLIVTSFLAFASLVGAILTTMIMARKERGGASPSQR
jgi:hypothetical protein